MLRLKINLRVRRSVRVKCPPPTHHSSLHFTPTVLACRIAANGNAWTISAALPEPRLPAMAPSPQPCRLFLVQDGGPAGMEHRADGRKT